VIRIEPRGRSSAFWSWASPILAIVLTIIGTGIVFRILGQAPGRAVYTFLVSPLLNANGLSALLVKAAPLIMIGAGLSLCYRANVWNIGAEGQFVVGAIFAGGLAIAFPDAPGWWLYPGMIVAGILGGMALAAIVAFLSTELNVNEILSSLMLTYVVQFLLIYLVTGPWRDPHGFGFPQTAMFSDEALSPILWSGTNMFEVAGPVGQLTTSISPGYGFTAVIVAFLGRLHPIGTIFAGLLLALSYLGGNASQIDLGMPNAVTGIFQGILLFFLLACDILILYRIRLVRPLTVRLGAAE
jgi:ABC-type uncharacterized transport system permease subunit